MIDWSKPESYKLVITLFEVDDKDGNSRFFEKTFLLINISIDIIFVMFFFTLSNVKVDFNN